jgi:adenine-specific DNA-methyltransferase
MKKIPKAVQNKCEWGNDDYSLQIKNLPSAQPRPQEDGEDRPRRRARSEPGGQRTFFDTTEVE